MVEGLIVRTAEASAASSPRRGEHIAAAAVVATAGTFLRGEIHIGETRVPAGRIDEPPAVGLSKALAAADLQLGRLKTGTPPRLDGRTIDYGTLQVQHGDDPPEPFSFLTERIETPQIVCHITGRHRRRTQ